METTLDPNTPTVITGDWNMRHPEWDNRTTSIPSKTTETLEWLEGNQFTLCNTPNVPTRMDQLGNATVIDLTFANGTAIEAGVIRNHRVDPDVGGLSDHHALTFQLGEPREIVQDLPSAKLNWKNADEEEFLKALKQEIKQAGPAHTDMVRKTLNVDTTEALPADLNAAITQIQGYLTRTAEETIPNQRPSNRSKPWWNAKITKAYKELQEAKETLQSWMHNFQTINHHCHMGQRTTQQNTQTNLQCKERIYQKI